MGVEIDTLTEEQAKYLASWDEGTLNRHHPVSDTEGPDALVLPALFLARAPSSSRHVPVSDTVRKS